MCRYFTDKTNLFVYNRSIQVYIFQVKKMLLKELGRRDLLRIFININWSSWPTCTIHGSVSGFFFNVNIIDKRTEATQLL